MNLQSAKFLTFVDVEEPPKMAKILDISQEQIVRKLEKNREREMEVAMATRGRRSSHQPWMCERKMQHWRIRKKSQHAWKNEMHSV